MRYRLRPIFRNRAMQFLPSELRPLQRRSFLPHLQFSNIIARWTMHQLPNRMLGVLILQRLYYLPSSLLLGFEWMRTLPSRMCCLLIFIWVHLHLVLGWIFSEFAQLHRLLAALRELQLSYCLRYLPGFFLLGGEYLCSLPSNLCDLHCLCNLHSLYR